MSDKPAIPEQINHRESKIQLLNLYDELSAFMHCNAFLNLAYLAIARRNEPLDRAVVDGFERSVCWQNKRSSALLEELRALVKQAHQATGSIK